MGTSMTAVGSARSFLVSTELYPSPPDLSALRAEGVTVLDEPAGKDFLRAVRIGVPTGMVVQSAQEAAAAAEQVGLPCVVKLVARDLPHKSDVGGVAGPLDSVADVEAAAARMLASAPPLTLGLLVEPWVRGSAEMFMGLSMNTSYGPVVVFGVGGIWVEEFQDVAYRLAPVDALEALEMIRSRRATRFLDGKHGTGAVAFDKIASVVQRFSRLALDPRVRDHVREIEVNPLIVRTGGDPIAVDCTVVLREAGGVVNAGDPEDNNTRN